MVEKYRGGLLPDGKAEAKKIWLTQVQHIEKVYQETMQTCAFTSALEQTWALITAANQYIDQTKPWSMAKEGKEQELDAVLYGLCEAIRHIAWMIRPVMPTTSEKILDAVGEKPNRDQGVFGQAKLFEEGDWDVTLWGGLEVGTRIQAVAPLFPRLG
jgi:methionyl-tRNA synthetase